MAQKTAEIRNFLRGAYYRYSIPFLYLVAFTILGVDAYRAKETYEIHKDIRSWNMDVNAIELEAKTQVWDSVYAKMQDDLCNTEDRFYAFVERTGNGKRKLTPSEMAEKSFLEGRISNDTILTRFAMREYLRIKEHGGPR